MKCISAKIHEINIENIYMHYSILYNTYELSRIFKKVVFTDDTDCLYPFTGWAT